MSATPNPTPVESGPTTCVVGCKLPHGLHMQLKSKDGTIVSHVLKGTNASRIVGGYGFTEAIPTEFMTEWLKRNAKHPAVQNGSIFMHNDARSAEARAKEGRDIRTGIEPIDPIENAKKFKLEPDAEAVRNYKQAQMDNPARGRQIIE